MTVKTTTVVLNAPTTNQTQDFTEAGFGPVKAAYIFCSLGEVDATPVSDVGLSYGMVETATSGVACTFVYALNAAASPLFQAGAFINRVVIFRNLAGERWRAGYNGTVTDGIQLDWTTTQGIIPPKVTVVLFGGDDVSADVVINDYDRELQ